MAGGGKITAEMVSRLFQKQMETLERELGRERLVQGNYVKAAELIEDIVLRDTFAEFMTLEGYVYLD